MHKPYFTSSLLVGCMLLFVTEMQAQRHPSQPPPTVITSSQLAFTLDLDNDGQDDLVVVDRATGSYRTGIKNASQGFDWSEAKDTGLTQIDSGAAAHFTLPLSPTSWSLLLVAKNFNNAQLVPLDGSDLPAPLVLHEPEPQTLCAMEPGLGQVSNFIVGFKHSGGSIPDIYNHSADFTVGSRWREGLTAQPSHAQPIYGKTTVAPSAGVITHAESGPGSRFLLLKEEVEDTQPDPTLVEGVFANIDGLPTGAQFTSGSFSYDQSLISAGHASATVLLWARTETLLRTARVTTRDMANNTSFPGQTLVTAPSYNMGRDILSVHVIADPAGTRLLLVWADAAGGASLYDFTGHSAPTLIEAVDLNGLDLEGVLPSANGQTVFLGKRGGQPAWDRMAWDGNHLARISTGSVPAAPRTAIYSNIVAFNGEPFVNPEATIVTRRRVKDWTTLASLITGIANVTALQDNGPTSGLGSPTVTQQNFFASHLLLSRVDSASSISFLGNTSAGTTVLPHVTLSPPPGSFVGSATVTMTATNMNSVDLDHIHYNTGSGWQIYDANAPPVISQTTTVKAYARTGASIFANQGPIVIGTYTILNSLPQVQTQPTVDADNNGLADTWESLTGQTDPGGDADGDGFLTLQEHNAGTDPNNLSSAPAAAAGPVGLALQNTPATAQSAAQLRWSALDTAVVLESSTNMTSWSVVTQGITRQGNENTFAMPTATNARYFYRLRR